jgi:hypothetical protein
VAVNGMLEWASPPAQSLVFRVATLPNGTSQFTAKSSDFSVVTVAATNEFGARTAPEVVALLRQGRYVASVAVGGDEPDAIGVSRRAEIAALDEIPPEWKSPNTSHRRSGL